MAVSPETDRLLRQFAGLLLKGIGPSLNVNTSALAGGAGGILGSYLLPDSGPVGSGMGTTLGGLLAAYLAENPAQALNSLGSQMQFGMLTNLPGLAGDVKSPYSSIASSMPGALAAAGQLAGAAGAGTAGVGAAGTGLAGLLSTAGAWALPVTMTLLPILEMIKPTEYEPVSDIEAAMANQMEDKATRRMQEVLKAIGEVAAKQGITPNQWQNFVGTQMAGLLPYQGTYWNNDPAMTNTVNQFLDAYYAANPKAAQLGNRASLANQILTGEVNTGLPTYVTDASGNIIVNPEYGMYQAFTPKEWNFLTDLQSRFHGLTENPIYASPATLQGAPETLVAGYKTPEVNANIWGYNPKDLGAPVVGGGYTGTNAYPTTLAAQNTQTVFPSYGPGAQPMPGTMDYDIAQHYGKDLGLTPQEIQTAVMDPAFWNQAQWNVTKADIYGATDQADLVKKISDYEVMRNQNLAADQALAYTYPDYVSTLISGVTPTIANTPSMTLGNAPASIQTAKQINTATPSYIGTAAPAMTPQEYATALSDYEKQLAIYQPSYG